MKKKVLIVYASYGSGHKAIANYIANYIKENDKKMEVATLDILTYSMDIIGSISQKVNSFFMLKTPRIHNFFYNLTSTKVGGDFIDSLSMSIFKNKKMESQIKSFNPDIVVATHFFGPSLIKHYNDKGVTNAKIITVITDYDVIELWMKQHKVVDTFVVGSKDMEKDLIKRGVDKRKIKVFGIPIAKMDKSSIDREKMLKEYNFKGDKPICIFFGGGGNGSSKTLPYIKRVAKSNKDLDIIYIAGKNEYSKEVMEIYKDYHELDNLRVLGFVTNIPKLLELCDFVVSKPGGIQLTECLYFKKPVLMIKNSGGQEIANYKYFEREGYGKYFKTSFGLNKYIKVMLNDKKILSNFKKNMRKNTHEDAIEKVYDLIKESIK